MLLEKRTVLFFLSSSYAVISFSWSIALATDSSTVLNKNDKMGILDSMLIFGEKAFHGKSSTESMILAVGFLLMLFIKLQKFARCGNLN